MPGRTDVDIANNSLVRLGSKPVNSMSVTTGTDKEIAVAVIYQQQKEALLAMHSWRFSMNKVQLARVVGTPVNEWLYAYQLPTAMLSGPRAVFNSGQRGAAPITEFEIFGDKLFTDQEEIYVDYQIDVDASKLPPWWVELLILACCGSFAPLVTDSTKLAQEYLQRAFGTPQEGMRGGYFQIAVGINAAMNPPNEISDNTLIDARRS